MTWLVVRTQTGREAWAAQNIERQGYEYYLPRFRETVFMRHLRRNVDRVRALFPSYIFVDTDGPWRWLTGTFGVSNLVLFGESPASLPDRAISALKSREDEEGLVILPTDPRATARRFHPGQLVKCIEGPFTGLEGIHQGHSGQEREWILLDFLHRKVPVLIGEGSLEEAAPPTPNEAAAAL